MRLKAAISSGLTSIILIGILSAILIACNLTGKGEVNVPCSGFGSFVVRTTIHNIHEDKELALVTARGRWRAVDEADAAHIPAVNSVDITCDKVKMVCTESIAKLYTELDDLDSIWSGRLFAFTNEYKVLEWTSSDVIAIHKPRAADIQISISLAHNIAFKEFTGTSARGAIDPNPEVQLWVLE